MEIYSITLIIVLLLILPYITIYATAIPVFQYSTGNKRVMNCEINAETLEECDSESYHQTVLVYAAPGIIVACFIAIITPIYFISKYLCNCCGGRKQSPNFCFPEKNEYAKYDKGDLIRPIILAVIVFCLCVAACIWGCCYLHIFTTQLNEMSNIVDKIIIQINNSNNELWTENRQTLYNNNNNSLYTVSFLEENTNSSLIQTTINERISNISSIINNTVIKLKKFTNEFIWVPYLIIIITTLISLIGLIIALSNCRKYASMSIFWIMALLGILVWLSNGFFAASSFFINESCFEVSEFTNRRINVIKAISNCNDNNFNDNNLDFKTIFNEEIETICNKILPYCYIDLISPEANIDNNSVLNCPSSMSCSTVNYNLFLSWINNFFFTSDKITESNFAFIRAKINGYTCISTSSSEELCDLRRCSKECMEFDTLSDFGKISKSLIYSIDALNKEKILLEYIGSQFITCDAILSKIIPSLYPSCQLSVKATYNVMQSFGLMGISIIISLFVYAWGAKRFIPFNQAFIPQKE